VGYRGWGSAPSSSCCAPPGPQSLIRRPELIDRTVARMAGLHGADLADTLRAVVLDPPDMIHQIGQLTVPVAVIAGADDYVLPASTRTTIHAVAPHASITIAGGGHISPEEDPSAVAHALGELLSRADQYHPTPRATRPSRP
jgi:pimeloyl-ACP methyl ester carboxylesterase